jgi:hypothetical protein
MRSLVPVLASLVLTTGCEGDDADAVRVFTGRGDGDLYVALVADDHDMVLYACDGTVDRVTVAEWFQGPHDDGSFDLESVRTTVRVTGDFEPDGGAGTLHIERSEQDFAVEVADGDAGLCFDEVIDDDGEHWGGWIVRPDGSIRGSVLNRKTGSIVPAGDATPRGRITVNALSFDVLRPEVPAL